jgi:hypothetical protein
MPSFASFENVGEMFVLFLAWPVAAGLALIALALAFGRQKRRASQGFAIAGMAASIPIVLVHATLILHSLEPASGPAPNYLLFLVCTLAPLVVAALVYWYNRRSLARR